MNHEGHKGHEGLSAQIETLGRAVVDAAFHVHRALGPGLLESAYEHCLAYELTKRDLKIDRQVALPVVYDELRLDAGYRIDLVVDRSVVIEVKAVDALSRLHEAQIMTYLKLSGHRLGYLINFNTDLFKQGIRRFVL